MAEIEKFEGENFAYWKMQIEDYLYEKKLHQALDGEKPESMPEAEWELMDRQVLSIIRSTLSKTVAGAVINEKTVNSLMASLSNIYNNPSSVHKFYLMKKLSEMKMKESTPVARHVSEFDTVINQLSAVGVEFDDEVKALKLLVSLPKSWNAVRIAISCSANKGEVKYNDIKDLILSEDILARDLRKQWNYGKIVKIVACVFLFPILVRRINRD